MLCNENPQLLEYSAEISGAHESTDAVLIYPYSRSPRDRSLFRFPPLGLGYKLRFGEVWINDHLPLVSEMPIAGYRQGGSGSDPSLYSIEEFTNVKHVYIDLTARSGSHPTTQYTAGNDKNSGISHACSS